MWTMKSTLNLIQDLHARPCLWDMQSADYKNRNLKVNAFDALAKKYCVSSRDVEKKIQVLRTQFRREHRKFIASDCSDTSKKSWFGYEQLMFLLRNESKDNRMKKYELLHEEDNTLAISDSELEDDIQINNQEREETSEVETPFTVRTPPPKRNKRTAHEGDNLRELFESTLNEAPAKRDDYYVYGEHVGNKLRSCRRNAFEIAIAQRHIDEILFNLTMGIYGRQTYSTTCSANSDSPMTITTAHPNYYHYPSSSNSSCNLHSPSHQSKADPLAVPILPSFNNPLRSELAHEKCTQFSPTPHSDNFDDL